MWGLFQQATQYIRQSPERGGEASYSRWDTRPTWVIGNRTPLMHREGPVAAQRVSPRPGRFSGRLPKPCVPRGQRTSGGPDVGAFPGRAIPRARVRQRKWVLSPGEPYPGRECLLGRTIIPRTGNECVYWIYVMLNRLKCKLSGDVLHL